MTPRDLFMRTFDPAGVHPAIVTHHRVWDREKFLASQQAMHDKAGERKEEDFRKVEAVDQKTYRLFAGYKPEHINND